MSHEDLTTKMIKLLKNNPRRAIKNLAKKLGINKTAFIGYLKALENQGYIRSKSMCLLKCVYLG